MGSSLSEIYRTAFVTGASSGLGQAFADMLAEEGVAVWGTSRDPDKVRREGGEGAASTPIRLVALDLGDPDDAEAAFRAAAREAGGCFDLVVNNAGYGIFGAFSEIPAGDWERQIAEMLGSSLRLCHVAWRHWLETVSADPAGGARRVRGLVNVSSLAVEFPLPFMCGYNAAKAGLSALSESLVDEGRRAGIRVMDFRPGDYRTSFNTAMRRGARVPPPLDRVWKALERNLAGAPPPEHAASDLRRALRAGRTGTVRSGSVFQAKIAPAFARLAPQAWQRVFSSRYFGVR